MTESTIKLARQNKTSKKALNVPLMKKKGKRWLGSFLRLLLIICLSYLILAPILQNIVVAFTHPDDLGMATSVWVPQNVSTQNWHVASLMINYAQALPYTFLHTSIMVILTYSFLLKSPVYEAAIAKTASMLVFLPLVVLYLFIQRKFVQGVKRSGITGM